MTDEELMRIALDEARTAPTHGDVPIGAVVVRDGEILSMAHNRREVDGDPTGHAEILAMREAATALRTWRLDGCTVVVTLEPCLMCAGAMVNSRVERVVFAAADPKAGAAGSLYNVLDDPRLNHRVGVTHGVLADEAAEMLVGFFAALR
ncbi:MAG: tRNA adenosine(34) deaminase TadA [Actinomycetota bacterium]